MAEIRVIQSDRAKMGAVVEFIVRYARSTTRQFVLGPFDDSCLKDGFICRGDVDELEAKLKERWKSIELHRV